MPINNYCLALPSAKQKGQIERYHASSRCEAPWAGGIGLFHDSPGHFLAGLQELIGLLSVVVDRLDSLERWVSDIHLFPRLGPVGHDSLILGRQGGRVVGGRVAVVSRGHGMDLRHGRSCAGGLTCGGGRCRAAASEFKLIELA